MKNVSLPESFDLSKLDNLKKELMDEAKQKCEANNEQMELLFNCECWDDCFSGFRQGEEVFLCFHYNIGKFTYAVGRKAKIK